jgi:hypothetical protein
MPDPVKYWLENSWLVAIERHLPAGVVRPLWNLKDTALTMRSWSALPPFASVWSQPRLKICSCEGRSRRSHPDS